MQTVSQTVASITLTPDANRRAPIAEQQRRLPRNWHIGTAVLYCVLEYLGNWSLRFGPGRAIRSPAPTARM
jgi:hypothetical protein